ncbi:MAG: type II secretion system F family protein [Pseudohongiellaceae bacterium]
MATFEYSGRDTSGGLVRGSLDAGSQEDVATLLFGDSITPIEIREVKNSERVGKSGAVAGAKDLANLSPAEFFEALTRPKVGLEELIVFSRQMYSLTRAGLPLDRAITGLGASLKNRTFQQILKEVVNSLENGMTLATAMGKHRQVFSQLFLSLVHVGENTGRLDLAFQEVGKYLELERSTRKQIKSATRYPMFVLAAIAVALGVVTVFVIPVFAGVFNRIGADLPWQTLVLIETSDFVIGYWPYMAGAGALLWFWFRRYLATEKGRLDWDRRKLGSPLMGSILERIALSRFARGFAMVSKAGLPIVQGLTIVAGAVGNAHIARHVLKMREGVERGESLYRTAVNSRMFSPLVLQMIAVGEESGNIDELLEEAADFYEAEVAYDLKRLGDAIEPILIVFIAGLVLILALGVFLPIWDLNTSLN